MVIGFDEVGAIDGGGAVGDPARGPIETIRAESDVAAGGDDHMPWGGGVEHDTANALSSPGQTDELVSVGEGDAGRLGGGSEIGGGDGAVSDVEAANGVIGEKVSSQSLMTRRG